MRATKRHLQPRKRFNLVQTSRDVLYTAQPARLRCDHMAHSSIEILKTPQGEGVQKNWPRNIFEYKSLRPAILIRSRVTTNLYTDSDQKAYQSSSLIRDSTSLIWPPLVVSALGFEQHLAYVSHQFSDFSSIRPKESPPSLEHLLAFGTA